MPVHHDNCFVIKFIRLLFFEDGEGEGEVAFFSTKHWDRRNRVDLIESATPCHGAQVVGPYRDSNPLRLTVLAAMSEDYTTAPQHLQEYEYGVRMWGKIRIWGGT